MKAALDSVSSLCFRRAVHSLSVSEFTFHIFTRASDKWSASRDEYSSREPAMLRPLRVHSFSDESAAGEPGSCRDIQAAAGLIARQPAQSTRGQTYSPALWREKTPCASRERSSFLSPFLLFFGVRGERAHHADFQPVVSLGGFLPFSFFVFLFLLSLCPATTA